MKDRNGKHTQGAWFVESDGISITMGGQVVATAITPDTANIETQKANARLIAAAPDLLEAAKATLSLWNKYGLGDDDNESEPVYMALKKAIAKAEHNQ